MQLSIPIENNVIVSPDNNNAVASTTVQLQDLIKQFIDSVDVCTESKNIYMRQMKQFAQWLYKHNKQLYALERNDIIHYKEYLISIKKSFNTIGGYITIVRKFFEWLESSKMFPNIARDVKGVKRSKGFRKDCLTPEQIIKILNLIDRSTLQGLRDYALINLLVRTGLRTIEISRATIEDLRQQAGEAILWIQGKGRGTKDEFVLLLEESLDPLREYLSRRKMSSETEPLFTQLKEWDNPFLTTRMISGIIKERFRDAGLDDKRLSAHSLRHTAISLSIKGGASLVQAQAMARHADPKTTMIYFHNQARIMHGAERYIKI